MKAVAKGGADEFAVLDIQRAFNGAHAWIEPAAASA
jgi:hypothetical protein